MIVSVAPVAQFYAFASAFSAKLVDWLLGFTCVFVLLVLDLVSIDTTSRLVF